MADPQLVLAERVRDALAAAYGDDYRDADPLVRPSSFADFQSNVALPLAKRLGKAPREIANELLGHLDVAGIAPDPTVSGPGFINFTLTSDWIAGQATSLLADPRLGTPEPEHPLTVVVEYSSPNIAKEMHVGHLRSTIVGDSLARTLEFAGHNVIRDNHVGDWGTPLGMLLEHLLDVGEDSAEAQLLRTNPNAFYQSARVKFDTDPSFAARARERVVKLQAGDEWTLRLWEELMELARGYLHDVYSALQVTLTDEDIRGESFYDDMLADTTAELIAKGLAVDSDGALCVFPPGFTGRDGSPLPVIIRKSDGGYNYSTTDLATIRYRVDKLNVDRAIYVVGSDQSLHFQMIFAVAKLAGWLPDSADYVHGQIGMVQGSDGSRLRTREGDNVKLSDLLAEGVQRARDLLAERSGDAGTETDPEAIAQDVGIGAIKYADLATARDSAYIFDWDRMISFRGNTGPYLQYATARIRSIFRKAELSPDDALGPIEITEPAERELALKLLGFGSVVTQVGETTEPHRLSAYLFEVASLFTTFYEQCPVLKADTEQARASRLALSAATLRVLTAGLDLLGVPIPDRM
ncbi:MAG: arginine--tRNA ligase [Streptosporangiaceae bacterium]|jgi:arginyl-tRNA synthetase